MALSLIDKEKSTKKSKPSKKLIAALDDDYRAKIFNMNIRNLASFQISFCLILEV